MYAIKQFYLKLFNAKTTMKDKTMMCDETKNECCNHVDPPWEGPQVIPAQIRRVDNLIFRKINQFARENDVEQATPMHGWIIGYLYRHRDTPVFQRDIEKAFSISRSSVTVTLQLMEKNGLSNYKIFMRTFKKLYGSTPQKMRSNRIRHV